MPNGKVQGANATGSDTVIEQPRLYETMWEDKVAERAGFEPARNLRPYAISSRAHSSTLAPLRARTMHFIIGSLQNGRKLRGNGHQHRESWLNNHSNGRNTRQERLRCRVDGPFIKSVAITKSGTL